MIKKFLVLLAFLLAGPVLAQYQVVPQPLYTNSSHTVLYMGTPPAGSITPSATPTNTNTFSPTPTWTPANTPTPSGITSLTNDVLATGPNSAAATVVGLRGIPVSTATPTNNQLLTYDATHVVWYPAVQAAAGTTIVSVAYQVSQGTQGGSAATGAWTNYSINTTLINTGGIATTVSGGGVVLPAGQYLVTALSGTCLSCSQAGFRLVEQLTPTPVAWTGYQNNGSTTSGFSLAGMTEFTLAGPITIYEQYYAGSNGSGTEGLGYPVGSGIESYGGWTVQKIQ